MHIFSSAKVRTSRKNAYTSIDKLVNFFLSFDIINELKKQSGFLVLTATTNLNRLHSIFEYQWRNIGAISFDIVVSIVPLREPFFFRYRTCLCVNVKCVSNIS